jgi:hypothetical protein
VRPICHVGDGPHSGECEGQPALRCLVERNAETKLAPLLLRSTRRASVSVPGADNRLRQVGVTFIGIALQNRESDDLALVVDGACGLQG